MTAAIPDSIQRLDVLFHRTIALLQSTDREVDAINAELQGIFSRSMRTIRFSCDAPSLIQKEVEYFESLVLAVAVKEFSLPGSPFDSSYSIPMADVRDAASSIYRKHEGAVRDQKLIDLFTGVSPVQMWHQVVKDHDPNAQVKLAAAQAARTIVYAFGLHRNSGPMKLVKGKAEIGISVRSEPKFGQTNCRTLQSEGTLSNLASALDIFVDQAMPDHDLIFPLELKRKVNSYNYSTPIISRERTSLGDGVELVTGYEMFKLYVPQSIAAELNLFLAEHGQEHINAVY